MAFIDFTKENLIGVKEIDNQHRGIYKTVNHLYKIQDHSKKEILEDFQSLLELLKTHFNTEESFMKEHKVIQFISHKLEHDRALNKYSDYYKKLKRSKSNLDPEILSSLRNWLINHHEKKDSKLMQLINKN